VGVFKNGLPKIKPGKLIPRLFLHEKNEKRIRWTLRLLTGIGIATSVVSLPWQQSLLLAIALVAVNYFLEQTLFYYTSLYVQPLPDFTYDPKKWVANAFVSVGEPSDPSSQKIVGLVFNDAEYAEKFFDLLRSWSSSISDDSERNICLSFITDEDMYYVYLYPSFEKSSIKQTHEELRRDNSVRKYGKEHLGLVMALIICKGFETKHGYALGLFTENHPQDKPFLLAPFIHKSESNPEPLFGIEPIRMYGYKAKIPSELTQNDFEHVHWRTRVRR
jgi:hypothetical protein